MNDDYCLRKMIEVKRIGTGERLMRKISTSREIFKFVAAFEKVYKAVEQDHSAVGHGGEKEAFAEAKKTWSSIAQEC